MWWANVLGLQKGCQQFECHQTSRSAGRRHVSGDGNAAVAGSTSGDEVPLAPDARWNLATPDIIIFTWTEKWTGRDV